MNEKILRNLKRTNELQDAEDKEPNTLKSKMCQILSEDYAESTKDIFKQDWKTKYDTRG